MHPDLKHEADECEERRAVFDEYEGLLQRHCEHCGEHILLMPEDIVRLEELLTGYSHWTVLNAPVVCRRCTRLFEGEYLFFGKPG